MKKAKTLAGMLAITCVLIASTTFGKVSYDDDFLDWKLDATIDNVEFYHIITECNGRKVVFLKFVNKNSNSVKVNWKEVFVTQQENAEKTEGPFREKQLVLLPGETFPLGCEQRKQQELLARPNQTTPVYQAEIIKFNFQDVRVTR